MKKNIILFLLFLISCKEYSDEIIVEKRIYFESPQPINDSELKLFPNKFLARYMNSDSTLLNFQKEYIFREHYYNFKVSNDFLDSLKLEYDILEREIVSKNYKDVRLPFRRLKDSIEIKEKKIDTIFRFSNTQKAKRINGNLVISKKDSIFWNIKLYIFDKEKLTVKQLYSDTDLKKMDSITKVKAKMIDSSTFIITPSRAEFKHFFKIKHFGYDTHYKKVKE